jgi:hypothetical protein
MGPVGLTLFSQEGTELLVDFYFNHKLGAFDYRVTFILTQALKIPAGSQVTAGIFVRNV